MKFRNEIETAIDEGETWDIVKGTAQLLKITKQAEKDTKTLLKNAGKTQEEMLKAIDGVEAIVNQVVADINKTSLPQDMKKTTAEVFVKSITDGVAKTIEKLQG